MSEHLTERLRALIKERETTAREVSIRAGGGPDLVRDIIRGKTKKPGAESILKIAGVLGTTAAYLMDGDNSLDMRGQGASPVVGARLIGKVQAGAFMQVDLNQEDFTDGEQIATVKDYDFPKLPQYAFEVVGDSIDKYCASGGYAICLDWAATGLVLKANMLVVVDRLDGGKVERTIKVAKRVPGGWSLAPASSNPRHQPITFPSIAPAEDVTIRFLVRRFVTPTVRW